MARGSVTWWRSRARPWERGHLAGSGRNAGDRAARTVALPECRGQREPTRLPAAVLIAVYALALTLFLLAPTDYGLLVPGPTVDTLGMLPPSKGRVQEEGHLLATTVGTVPRTNVLNLLEAIFVPWARVVPTRRLVGQDESVGQFVAEGLKEMEDSKTAAEAAALRYSGREALVRGDGAQVISTADPIPVGLQKGDVIFQAGDDPVTNGWDLDRAAHGLLPGQVVQLSAVRGEVRFVVQAVVRADERGFPSLGIGTVTVNPRVLASRRSPIRTGDIIGPSAGLMMALAFLDRLSGDSLTRGHAIAGTGTISPSGAVGAVGGVAQKVAGAERAGASFFLVPTANYAEAAATAQRLQVIPVASLDDAVRFLQTLPRK